MVLMSCSWFWWSSVDIFGEQEATCGIDRVLTFFDDDAIACGIDRFLTFCVKLSSSEWDRTTLMSET
jgi:hypothetical protein